MEDLFMVLCERNMTDQKKKDLSAKITALFNAQNQCSVINSNELTQLSEKVQTRVKEEVYKHEYLKRCFMGSLNLPIWYNCACSFCSGKRKYETGKEEILKRIKTQTALIIAMQTNQDVRKIFNIIIIQRKRERKII